MMTKKDYERAAKICQAAFDHFAKLAARAAEHPAARDFQRDKDDAYTAVLAIRDAFVVFFEGDNPHFDRATFLAACTGQKRPSAASRRR
jgi:hypothetical protein